MSRIRKAAVAGTFYPASPDRLSQMVDSLLAAAILPDGPPPKALIAPHAGYVYSGPVAASAFKRIAPLRGRITRAVLIGPAHFVAFEGIATSSADGFATPLGTVPVDQAGVEQALRNGLSRVNDEAHAPDHALEVELPFLQRTLGEFAIVPLLVGSADAEDVAALLDRVYGGSETLIVVSSDLSHFYDYETARRLDSETCRSIESLEPQGLHRDSACGHVGIQGLLEVARNRGLRPETLDLRSSGDTAGSRESVVGYGAWAFVEPASDETVSRGGSG